MSAPLAMRFLSVYLDELTQMPWAEEAWDELTFATDAIERMVDRRAAAMFAGRCDVCGLDLYATATDETVTCRPCNVTYHLGTKRQEMLDALDDRLVRASEAVHILPGLGMVVSRKDLDRWTSTSRLLPHGHDERGRPLFRVSDVRYLASTTVRRTRPASVT